jgi:hypothetical protein
VTPGGDDVHEMPRRRPIDEQAVESLLGGSPMTTGDDLDELRAFVLDVRAAASGPMPAPSSELEHVLTRGISTDKGDLPATAASNADGPALQAAGLPKWRSAQMKVSRYVAGLSIGAKILLGAGAVFAATAGAGAAGVLPGPVQDAVDAVAPFTGDAPEATPPTTTPTDGVSTDPGHGTGTTTPPGSSTEPGTGTGQPPETPTTSPPEPAPTTVAPIVGTPPSDGDSPSTPPPTETPVAESMSIQCSLNGEHTSVSCEWTGAPPDTFGKYVLLRTSDDGKPGRVLTQSSDITTHSWVDTLALTPGVTYSYMVDSIAPDGSTSGHSNRVYITF